MFKKYIFLTFIFTLFSIVGCQNDKTEHQDDPYFEDYEAPKDKWGFTDKTGKIVISAKYDAVGKFSDGLAAANYRGEWGYIDHAGEIIIPFQYKAAYAFHEAIGRVLTFEGDYLFLDKEGVVIKTINLIDAGDFSEGLAKVNMSNLWGYINRQGGLIIEPIYERAWNFDNGYAKVMKYGQYGMIDKNGSSVLPIEFDGVYGISDGYFLVKNQGRYSFFDGNGVQKLGPFEKASSFNEGTAFVVESEALHLINQDGERIKSGLPYELPRYLGNGLYMANQDGLYGLINSRGEALTTFDYQQFNEFHEGIAAYMQDELWGFINERGELLCKPVFGLAWDFHDGFARAAFRDGIAYVNKIMAPPFYPEFLDMQDFTEGLAAVQVRK